MQEYIQEIALLVGGAFIGVLFDLWLRPSLRRLGLQIKRRVARLTKQPDPFADRPHQLRFGNTLTDWVSLYGTGEVAINSRYLRTELIDEYVSLPVDLNALRAKARRELTMKEKNIKADVWNS